MARYWIWSAGARERMTRALEGSPHGRIVPEEELRRLGIWFDDGRYGHLIFLLEPGGIIMPSDMGRIPFAGMHGYHPSEPTTEAVLLASVPILEKVDHITGIYDLVLNDLGLTSGGPQS
ncbi:MAG: hypothetical protein HY613_09630 [Candidatus Rokubacteria bacterium]|nr:hypothetical protein [Candidatus Rokubacteria bacterium]